MRIKIVRNVPGLVNFRPMLAGEEYELESATAVSLIQDGYANPVASAPVAQRETRTRQRKES